MPLFLDREFRRCETQKSVLWEKIKEHDFIKTYDIEAIELSVMVAAYGFMKSTISRKEIVKQSPGGWLKDLSTKQENKAKNESKVDNLITMIIAIAVTEENNLSILEEDVKSIQKIAEEYANGALEDFYELLIESKSADIFYGELYQMIIDNV